MVHRLRSQLESLLFVAQKPLSIKKLTELTHASREEVRAALEELARFYILSERGIILLQHDDAYELATHPELSDTVQAYTKEEVAGELTRAGLETLTVIAYRGPIGKHEIERIRGVNCTVVLRNLSLRGLIESTGDDRSEKAYVVSFDFLRHLEVSRIEELPDYTKLHNDEHLQQLLEGSVQPEESTTTHP